jgi:hypothetical protein
MENQHSEIQNTEAVWLVIKNEAPDPPPVTSNDGTANGEILKAESNEEISIEGSEAAAHIGGQR